MSTPPLRMLAVLALLTCTACRSPASTTAPDPARSPSPTRRPAKIEPLTVRVGSWNVRRLGQAKTDLRLVADVIEQFDIIAIQEVMTREVADALRDALPDHRILLTDTPRPIQGSYREYYAFVYRAAQFDPVMNAFYPDPDDVFVRDPYVACFDGDPRVGRLCLMTVHIVWGERVAQRKDEILAVDDALAWARGSGLPAEWIVVGDFNRPFDDGDRDTEPEQEWLQLVDPAVRPSAMIFVGPEMPTTLGAAAYANAYDHCFVSEPLQANVRAARRFDLVAEVCDGSFERCRTSVSDHAPYYVEFRFP